MKNKYTRAAENFRPVSAEHQRHQAIFAGEDVTDFVPDTDEQQRRMHAYALFRAHHQELMDARDRRRR